MAYHITHRKVEMTSNPYLSAFPELLIELKKSHEDQERCSISVTLETEWVWVLTGVAMWSGKILKPARHAT
jgi:hypothetical protein